MDNKHVLLEEHELFFLFLVLLVIAIIGSSVIAGPFSSAPHQCRDGIDNDNDTKIDYPNDPGCKRKRDNSELNSNVQCDDGIDNDGDTTKDYPSDTGCASLTDKSERGNVQCDNGIDDDKDTKIDYPSDSGCTSPSDISEADVVECNDGIDNDGDLKIDYPNDLGCSNLSDTSELDSVQPNVLITPPSPIVFTRYYNGAKSASGNRKWSWQPGIGGGSVERYWVKPSWTAGFFTTNTTWVYAETYNSYRWGNPPPLPAGTYTVSVQAVNTAGMSAPVNDTIIISYFKNSSITDMGKQDMGLGGVTAYFAPGQEITNAVKLRYKFKVVQNENQYDSLKIIFNGHRLYGPGGSPYAIEEDFYTEKILYNDPVCDVDWLQGTKIQGISSIRVAISDYTNTSKTGIKTFAPNVFPRAYSLVDGIHNITKYHMMSQVDIDGIDGIVEISRGNIITDKSGWRCNINLGTDNYREWDVSITINGIRYDTAIAIPDNVAQYLSSPELFNPRTEFFLLPGYFKVYFWDVEVQQENILVWEKLNSFKVTEFDGYPVDFGVTKSVYNGVNVIELSNDAPGTFFLKDYIFTLNP